jgi:beta-lactamase class A
VLADEAGEAETIPIPLERLPWDVIEDRILKGMRALDEIAPFEDKAPLWDHMDAKLQKKVNLALEELDLMDDARKKRLAVVLVDATDLEHPRVAAVNGDEMMYAASLPKIAVLLGAFEKIAEGKLRLDAETERQLEDMIRVSSNAAATAMARKVGKQYIARTMLSPRYRLYDPAHNGGLWVGKDYAKAGLWKRDPLHNLSHGATAMQVARFYYLLETGNLVTPDYSQKMKQILANPGINHKFVSGLNMVNPSALLFRKSGSWRSYHSDSVLVERDGRSYIAVALANSPDAKRWLGPIIVALDSIVFGKSWLHGLAGVN